MKYIKTKDWFLNYKDIKNIYKKDERNVNQKCDKKGNVTDPGYTIFRIFIDYIDITGNSNAQSQISFTTEEERDKLYEEIVDQVIGRSYEPKDSSTVKATKGTTKTMRIPLNE